MNSENGYTYTSNTKIVKKGINSSITLQNPLTNQHIEQLEQLNLSPFQRILIATDGTLTQILEAYFLEKIKLVKLSEEVVKIKKSIPALDLDVGTQVIERKILLQGKISLNNFIYAESIIIPERLDDRLNSRLIESQEPMGSLWLKYKLETFKEIIDSAIEPAEGLSNYFNIARKDKMLSRTYRVLSNKKPIIMITEKFPKNYFLNHF